MDHTFTPLDAAVAPPAPAPVRVHTLGRFRVEVEGEPLQFETKARHRPLELLKVLIALGGEGVPVERLCESLWPESDGDRAHSAFTTTLNRLRKLVGRECLHVRDGRLYLLPAQCWVDAPAFAERMNRAGDAAGRRDAAAVHEAVTAALELYRGPFLDGEFEPAEILSARERLHGLFLRQLGRVGRFYWETGAYESAIGLYRRGLEVDDLAEELYQHLMRCYLELGRLVEGVALFQRCRELFRASVGIAPSAETEALHQALLDAQQRPPPAVVARPPTDVPAGAPPRSPPPPAAPAQPAPQPAQAATGERRQTTVAVHRLCGYGGLGEHLDPEEMQGILARFAAEAEATVARHGGAVSSFVRDELTVLYGVPNAHEDDPQRAVEGALALHELARRLDAEVGERAGEPLALCSGIHTGLLLARTEPERPHRLAVTGHPLDISAGLAATAQPGGIVISAVTRRLVADYFVCEMAPPVALPGKALPVTPYVVTGRSGVGTRLEAAVERGLTPFTGRAHEMSVLRDCMRRALGGEGQVVTVIGEPGIGKSRLLHEFHSGLDRQRLHVLEGRNHSRGRDTPYLPFADALRRALRLHPSDSLETLHEKVVTRILAVDAALEPYLPYYLYMLSVPSQRYALPPGATSEQLRRGLQEAIVAIAVQATRTRPMVLLLEDWHWADDSSTAALKTLAGAAASHPILIVVSCRPELEPNWGHVARHTTLPLLPLDGAETGQVVQATLGAARVPPSLTARIHERAAGNPFFAEEICRSLLEDGAVEVTGGAAHLRQPLETLSLPETVQAVIRTRVDRLPPEALRVLRLAAVIGRDFGLRLLERVAAPEPVPAECLETLQALELVQQTQVVPEPAYRFKHVLTQVVVYESILLQRRPQLHAAVGEALEALYADRLDEQYEALAYHFAQSDRPPIALRYQELAGDRAAQSSALTNARNHFRAALRLADEQPLTPELRRKRIELSLKWVAAAQYAPTQEQLDALARSQSYAQELGEQALLARVIYWRGRHLYVLGHMTRAQAEFEQVTALAEALHDEPLRAQCIAFTGRYCFHAAQYDRGGEYLQRGSELMERLGNRDEAIYARSMLAVIHGWCGRFEESFALYRAMIDEARATRNPTRESAAQVFLAMVQALHGDWAEALRHAQAGTERAEHLGNDAISGMGRWTQGYAAFMLGERERGFAHIAEVADWPDAGRPGRMLIFLAWLAEMHALAGDPDAARAVGERALWMRGDTGQRTGEIPLQRALARAALCGAEPDWRAATAHLREGLHLARVHGARPDHAITSLRYAEVLSRTGETDKARHHLRQATSQLRRMNMTWWLEQAAALAPSVG